MSRNLRICAAVAGSPIEHSLTPHLFRIICNKLRALEHTIELHISELIESESLVDVMAWGHTNRAEIAKDDPHSYSSRTEVWLSLTTPLKHQMSLNSGVEWVVGNPLLACANQLRNNGRVWSVADTDGRGLVRLAKEIDFDFTLTDAREKPLLCMTGGGSTARSCAAAWVDAGGLIWWRGGRRQLSNRGPWSGALLDGAAVTEHVGRRLHVDFDVEAGTDSTFEGERVEALNDVDTPVFLNVSYGTDEFEPVVHTEWGTYLDGRWLLVAQHLEAWRLLFCPEAEDDLPSIRELMDELAKM